MTAENGHLNGTGNLTENRHPVSKWQTVGRNEQAHFDDRDQVALATRRALPTPDDGSKVESGFAI